MTQRRPKKVRKPQTNSAENDDCLCGPAGPPAGFRGIPLIPFTLINDFTRARLNDTRFDEIHRVNPQPNRSLRQRA